VKYDGPYPFIDGLIFRVTTSITQVDAEHHDRYAGRSNYNLPRSISIWLRLATSFSLVPLRLATFMGFAVAAAGLVLALFFVVRRLLDSATPIGWASTIVVVLVLGGAQLVSLGMIGEYLGRAYLDLNRKPQYVVREATRQPEPAGESRG
jgi:polyisoprenyl-phosphate glycosyltransferase